MCVEVKWRRGWWEGCGARRRGWWERRWYTGTTWDEARVLVLVVLGGDLIGDGGGLRESGSIVSRVLVL